MLSRRCHCVGIFLLTVLAGPAFIEVQPNWPGWRGPSQDGHSSETVLPMRWTPDDVEWRVPLKGRGQCSPIIWGERIFLTTALDDGRQRVVMCRNRNDGHLIWEHVVWTGEPEISHTMNGWASASCVTDGEQVYAFFGRGGGLHCFTVEGDPIWQQHRIASLAGCRVILAMYQFHVLRVRGEAATALQVLKHSIADAERGMAAWPEDTSRETFYVNFLDEAQRWAESGIRPELLRRPN